MDEIREIFKVTGGMRRFENIEEFSKKKAKELNMQLDDGIENEYFQHIYKTNNGSHTR
jgi:hypothetical protein